MKLTVLLPSLLLLSTAAIAQLYSPYLFDKNYFKTFTFNCQAGFVVAFTSDKNGLTFYDVIEEHFMVTYNLTQQGYLVGIPNVGNRIVIVEENRIDVISGGLRTHIVPVKMASSLALVSDLACLVPTAVEGQDMDDTDNVVCMNLTARHVKSCNTHSNIPPGSLSYVNEPQNWVYFVHDKTIVKSALFQNCLQYIRSTTNQNFNIKKLWFSYDGTRVFLDNGLTLFASNDSDKDMQHAGYFDNSDKHRYIWFSQPSMKPYNIAAIREDQPDIVQFFEWPSLRLVNETKISIPHDSTRLDPQSVYYCDGYNGLVLIFGQFVMKKGNMITGVSFINLAD